MGYIDTSDAEIIALTRRRRADGRFFAEMERSAAREAHERLTFPFVQQNAQDLIEAAWREREVQCWWRSPPHIVWKNKQWSRGVRNCQYCGIRMTRTPNVPRTCTVDHRRPRALGGKDDPSNWILSCLDCNGRKGLMSEAQFRQHLAVWRALGDRLTG